MTKTGYMTTLALSTWVCIAIGYFVNPIFYLIGALIFLTVAIIWTYYAFKEKVDWRTIALVWGVPLVMIMFFGFGATWLPPLPSEKKELENKQ